MIVYLNGKFIYEQQASLSIDDAGFLFGHGVYETLRTYNGKLKFVPEHYQRLKNSAKITNINLPLSESELYDVLTELIDKNTPSHDLRIRITVSAGTANFVTRATGESTLLITAQAIRQEADEPIRLVSFRAERAAPEVKSTSMLVNVLAQQYSHSHDADEAVFIGQNREITEGSFSNIFVVKNGVVITPSKNILGGITRQLVLRLARNTGQVEERAIELAEVLEADELFITSTVRGIVAVKQFDDKTFSAPGPITKKLQSHYRQEVFG